MLRLHDTALGQVRPLELRQPGQVSLYVCGPTVYGEPHLGHGRFALVWDVLRRYLAWRGLQVTFVSNITDIDDNIIAKAEAESRPWTAVVEEYERVWWESMDRLGVRRPDHEPHATAYVERMVEVIAELEQRGFAYDSGDSVWFAAEQVPGYGLLARQPLESLRAGARVEVDEGKRSPVDFALWKKAKPGEPSWPSPWGDGRPGWHTECVVMSLDLLGEGFDLHGGGIDLAFPHHENERAQAIALGRPFARTWVHSGHVVGEGGVKMSKSLGNYTTLVDLLDRTDPRAYRMLVLQSHYHGQMEVTPSTIDAAAAAVRGLDALARDLPGVGDALDQAAIDRFIELMDDDLDTPGALALAQTLVRRANKDADVVAAATALHLVAVLGLEPTAADEVDAASAQLVSERDTARAARDFARADALRDALVATGWVVEDTPQGTRIHR